MKSLNLFQKRIAIGVLAAILLCVVAGVVVRFSYTDDIQQLKDNPDTVVWFYGYQKMNEKNFDFLFDADIIVRAVADDEGFVSMENTRTKLTVEETYKGDLSAGDSFYFWSESGTLFDSVQNTPVYRSANLLNIFQKGKEYIVFANKKYVNEEYDKRVKIPTYIPANYPLDTAVKFNAVSYFDVDSRQSTVFDEQAAKNSQILYGEFRQNEIFTFSASCANDFYALKQRVFQELGIAW